PPHLHPFPTRRSSDLSYDPDNHARMTKARADKIAGITNDIPLQTVALGEDHGKLAVVGWGSTFGAIHRAVQIARDQGRDVAHIQDRKSTRLNSSHVSI